MRPILQTWDAAALAKQDDHPLVARARAVDPDDAAYLACVMATDARYLWTRDKALQEAFPGRAVPLVPEE